MEAINQFEVIIIGGSYAGLSAAMALGRSMRKVLIIDSGKPCNRFTPQAHNLITHDGQIPADIAADAKRQVMRYPTIIFVEDLAVAGEKLKEGFAVSTRSGKNFTTKKIIFATGVTDEMPALKGFAECWGKSVLHCPYCHGYEVKDTALGLLANGDMAFEFGRLISNWSRQLILFTNGASTLSLQQSTKLKEHAITIIETPVEELIHTGGQLEKLKLADGSLVDIHALFSKISFSHPCSIPAELGCAFTEHGFLQVDEFLHTSIPGIFAAGDNTTMFRALSVAMAAGTKAGAMVNKELTEELF